MNDKKLLYQLIINLESKSCKIFFIMYCLSDENGKVKTSLNDLQQRSKMAKKTIQSALKELETKKIIEIHHNAGLETDYKILI